MGLCLSVGFVADLKENDPESCGDFQATLARLNQALTAAGLPPHHEPETIRPEDFISLDMYGYSGLHYLRRIAAHLNYTEKLPPPGDNNASEDNYLKRYYEESIEETPEGLFAFLKRRSKPKSFDFNHLILHSDAEGFYIPVDFVEVIFPDSSLEIPGAMIGSAHRLLKECRCLADTLGIPGEIDAESDELWKAVDSQGKDTGWKRYGVESFTCVRLIRACEACIRSGAVLVFT